MSSPVERAASRAVVDLMPVPTDGDLEAIVAGVETAAVPRVDVVFDPLPGQRL